MGTGVSPERIATKRFELLKLVQMKTKLRGEPVLLSTLLFIYMRRSRDEEGYAFECTNA